MKFNNYKDDLMSNNDNENYNNYPLLTEGPSNGVYTSDKILETVEETKDEVMDMFDQKIVDLDAKRIAVISDPHSNLLALNAVLDDLENRNYDALINLGDLVGYYTQPEPVINKVRSIASVSIIGNHDFALIEPAKMLYTTLQEGAQAAIDHNKPLVSAENKKWLGTLPFKMIVNTPYASLSLVHGDPITIFGYVYGMTPALFKQSIINSLNYVNTDYLLVGHSHIQGEYFHTDGKVFVNPGAVGQPRDGDSRAAYAIIDLEKRKNELYRVKYDYNKVAKMVIECKLPVYLGDRLSHGE